MKTGQGHPRPPASAAHSARRLRQRLALLFVLVTVAVLAATSDHLYSTMYRVVTDLEPFVASHPLAGAVVFAGLAALSALLAFFSSTLLVPVAVQAWGEPFTIALLWIGWIAGGIGAYSAGRWLGRPVARHLAGSERLDYYESRFGRRTPFGVVLLFHLALQSEIPGLVLGTLRYRFPLFVLALGLAELPYAVGAVYLGSFVLERQTVPLLVGAFLAAAASIWAIRALTRVLREEETMTTPG